MVKFRRAQRRNDTSGIVQVRLSDVCDLSDTCSAVIRRQFRGPGKQDDARKTLGDRVVNLSRDTATFVKGTMFMLSFSEPVPGCLEFSEDSLRLLVFFRKPSIAERRDRRNDGPDDRPDDLTHLKRAITSEGTDGDRGNGDDSAHPETKGKQEQIEE